MSDPRASPPGIWHRKTASDQSQAMSASDLGAGSEVVADEQEMSSYPTSSEGPGYSVATVPLTHKYVFVTVGLPARGKTFLAQKLCRYLAWLGHSANVYNVQPAWRHLLHQGKNARVTVGDVVDCYTTDDGKATFKRALDATADKVKAFFASGGHVAIVNDDFITAEMREHLEQGLAGACHGVLYLEIIREGVDNSQYEVYKAQDKSCYGCPLETAATATEDFAARLAAMTRLFEPISTEKSLIRVRNGSHIDIHNIRGYLPSKMLSFLLNVSQSKTQHPIYFTRHGQSEYNLEDRLGGNPHLTRQGQRDALSLRTFVEHLQALEAAGNPSAKPMQLWTSQLTRTIQTGRPSELLGLETHRWRQLNEIHAGVCEGLTYADVKRQYPLIHEFREKNKYAFRYPDGESYQDLVTRIEPIIMELENAERVVVVVAHQAVLRALLSYFGTASAESSVRVEVPHRTVWRCCFNSFGVPLVDQMELPKLAEGDIDAEALDEIFGGLSSPTGLSGELPLSPGVQISS
jgi:broad specificity phosphatase PhoE